MKKFGRSKVDEIFLGTKTKDPNSIKSIDIFNLIQNGVWVLFIGHKSCNIQLNVRVRHNVDLIYIESNYREWRSFIKGNNKSILRIWRDI